MTTPADSCRAALDVLYRYADELGINPGALDGIDVVLDGHGADTWTRLRWESRQFAEHGFRAGVSLFSIATATMAADLKAAAPYVLRCALPGVDRPMQVESVAAAKARAESILDGWLAGVVGDDATSLAALRDV